MRIPTSSTPKPPEINPATTSPDGFDEFELTDEHTRPVSPIRRRRPSDVGMPRSKTSRQLTEEIEKLKDSLLTSNMRVELLKKNNSELQHTTTKLKERVEELEPYEEENNELQDENNHLRLKMQEMEEEMERLKDDNDELRRSNEDMLAINVECSSHWEDQEAAVQEAADAIIALEREKAALAVEVHKLKERVTLLEDDSSRASTLVNGSSRAPSIVYSIDESRPSTSHFDSDYYSQPDSPQVKRSKESIISIEPSARSKKFLELTQERRRSARDLAKRMSTASLAALRMASLKEAGEYPSSKSALLRLLNTPSLIGALRKLRNDTVNADYRKASFKMR
jgi:chromosome segregation ATPase